MSYPIILIPERLQKRKAPEQPKIAEPIEPVLIEPKSLMLKPVRPLPPAKRSYVRSLSIASAVAIAVCTAGIIINLGLGLIFVTAATIILGMAIWDEERQYQEKNWQHRKALRDYQEKVQVQAKQEKRAREKAENRYKSDLKKYEAEKAEQEKAVKLASDPEYKKKKQNAILREQLSKTLKHDGTTEKPKTGYSEPIFYKTLCEYFGEAIHKNLLVCNLYEKEFEYKPDFTFIKNGLYIDIEIDEPYQWETGVPTHYIGADDKRNDWIKEKYGWVIIRFTERQVTDQSDSCCKVVARTIAEIFDEDLSNVFDSIADLKEQPEWTWEEAKEMERKRDRNPYKGTKPKLKWKDN